MSKFRRYDFDCILKQLPKEQRYVLKELIVLDKGYKEVAGSLRVSNKELRQIIRKAWKSIRLIISKPPRRSRVKEERKSLEYQKWRMAVFERDGFTCLECNATPKELHAHHIFSFAKYTKLRYVVENGVTLCKKCHRRIHPWAA